MATEKAIPGWLKGIFIGAITLLAIASLWIGYRVAAPDRSTPFAGTPPQSLGVTAGHLMICPEHPNCVSSQSTDPTHQIAPFPFQGSSDQAIVQLKRLLVRQARAKLMVETDNYLRAEFTSRWLGYVDDVEFLLEPDSQTIEVRSASRLGESDLGVNRQRIETLRRLFEAS